MLLILCALFTLNLFGMSSENVYLKKINDINKINDTNRNVANTFKIDYETLTPNQQRKKYNCMQRYTRIKNNHDGSTLHIILENPDSSQKCINNHGTLVCIKKELLKIFPNLGKNTKQITRNEIKDPPFYLIINKTLGITSKISTYRFSTHNPNQLFMGTKDGSLFVVDIEEKKALYSCKVHDSPVKSIVELGKNNIVSLSKGDIKQTNFEKNKSTIIMNTIHIPSKSSLGIFKIILERYLILYDGNNESKYGWLIHEIPHNMYSNFDINFLYKNQQIAY